MKLFQVRNTGVTLFIRVTFSRWFESDRDKNKCSGNGRQGPQDQGSLGTRHRALSALVDGPLSEVCLCSV